MTDSIVEPALVPAQSTRRFPGESTQDRSARNALLAEEIADRLGSGRGAGRHGRQGNGHAPWEGSWSDYQTRDGMTVPNTGEAAWLRPEGRKPYFRGTVTSLSYEFAP
jgi:hypothetical protein